MNRLFGWRVIFLVLLIAFSGIHCDSGETRVFENENMKIVVTNQLQADIFIDGQLFTTYRYGLNNEKPIFFPVNSPKGQMLTRGWPLIEGIEGEKQDHVHHQGLSFTYGDVNHLDFWAEPGDSTRNGKIIPKKTEVKSVAKNRAVLEFQADWVTPDGKVLLVEDKNVVLLARENYRAMDFSITLTAKVDVLLGDTKEGMFGIRVTSQLQDGNDGEYLNSNGQKAAAECWGQRAAWVVLQGPVNDEKIALGIFVHPASLNFPPYWHARDYGLFTVNPLGRAMYTNGAEEKLELSLKPGETMTFKARVLIFSGQMSPEQLDAEYAEYKATK
jgi:hypothetical protein